MKTVKKKKKRERLVDLVAAFVSRKMKERREYLQSDVQLMVTTYWENKQDKIDGFYFYSKQPKSKAYQYHGTVALENAERILRLLDYAIEGKKEAAVITIRSGLGTETVSIHKNSLESARRQLLEMLESVEKQQSDITLKKEGEVS